MATQKELTAEINALGETVSKIGSETQTLKQKVTDLEDALENQTDASPELVAAVEALKTQVQVVDELVPDGEVPPPDPEPEPA